MFNVILFTECNGTEGWGRDAGAYTITSSLRHHGISTLAVDFFSSFTFETWKKLIDQYVSKDTHLLCFSSTHFSTLLPDQWVDHFKDDHRSRTSLNWDTYFPFSSDEMTDWMNYAKSKNPALHIVVGGQKVAQKAALRSKFPCVDVWVGGMAEKSIVTLYRRIADGEKISGYIKSEADIGGISEKEFKSSFINWSSHDFVFENEALPLEMSRGCPFRCSFCDYRKKKKGTWIKDLSLLRDYLIGNWERYGTSRYMITDFLVNEDIDKTTAFWKVSTSLPFKLKWSGFSRLDLLSKHPEMIDLLYESGACSIQWGIESINRDVGSSIGKNTSRDEIERLLSLCKSKWKDEVIMGSGFIVGLPGDTVASTQEMFNWLAKQEWLHGWEISPLFIGGYDKKREYTIDYSRIQQNPANFGYNSTVEKVGNSYVEQWKMGEMTKDLSIHLIEEFQKSEGWKKRLVPSFHGYHRMHNLGFNDLEIRNMNRKSDGWVTEMHRAYSRKSAAYFNKLFSVPAKTVSYSNDFCLRP